MTRNCPFLLRYAQGLLSLTVWLSDTQKDPQTKYVIAGKPCVFNAAFAHVNVVGDKHLLSPGIMALSTHISVDALTTSTLSVQTLCHHIHQSHTLRASWFAKRCI